LVEKKWLSVTRISAISKKRSSFSGLPEYIQICPNSFFQAGEGGCPPSSLTPMTSIPGTQKKAKITKLFKSLNNFFFYFKARL